MARATRATPRGKASMALVMTTTASRSEASRLIEDALGLRLVACAISWKVRSRYWWRGRLESAQEWLILFKTTPPRVRGLMERLEQEHPYEVPEIAQIDVKSVSAPYLRWLMSETGGWSAARKTRAIRTTRRPG